MFVINCGTNTFWELSILRFFIWNTMPGLSVKWPSLNKFIILTNYIDQILLYYLLQSKTSNLCDIIFQYITKAPQGFLHYWSFYIWSIMGKFIVVLWSCLFPVHNWKTTTNNQIQRDPTVFYNNGLISRYVPSIWLQLNVLSILG